MSVLGVLCQQEWRWNGGMQVEEAVSNLYVQQCSSGAAAGSLAAHLGIPSFVASNGCLWHFRKRHIFNKKICGEAPSGDVENVKLSRQKLNSIMIELRSEFSPGAPCWPSWAILEVFARKYSGYEEWGGNTSQKGLSALLCANSDGSHRLKSVIVGRSKHPQILKDCMDRLPVLYYNSVNAWLIMQAITRDCFHHHFDPNVRRHQIEVLKLAPENVEAISILDNAPSHWNVMQSVWQN